MVRVCYVPGCFCSSAGNTLQRNRATQFQIGNCVVNVTSEGKLDDNNEPYFAVSVTEMKVSTCKKSPEGEDRPHDTTEIAASRTLSPSDMNIDLRIPCVRDWHRGTPRQNVPGFAVRALLDAMWTREATVTRKQCREEGHDTNRPSKKICQ